MRSFNDAFRAAIDTLAENEIAEHLEDAARALASMDAPTARSIASIHVVDPRAAPGLRAVAADVARRYGLDVKFEERTSLRIRFSR